MKLATETLSVNTIMSSILLVLLTVLPAASHAESMGKLFKEKDLKVVVNAITGGAEIKAATDEEAHLWAPNIAEGGDQVSVRLKSGLKNIESVALIAESNPRPLVASFSIRNGKMPLIKNSIKMAKTGYLTALIKADGKFYSVKKKVKITIGGCGG